MKSKIGWNPVLSVLAVFFIVASAVSAVSYPPAISGQFLYDKAGKLSAPEFTDLNNRLIDYQQKTTNEIAVVTTQDLQGQSLGNYAKGLFNEWGVGRRDVNNGVLILLSLDTADRGVWIQPGDGVDGYFDEESIAGEMIPYFKSQEWASGLDAGVEAVMDSMPTNWPAASAAAVPAADHSSQPYQPTASSPSNDSSGGSTIVYVVVVVVGGILLLLIGKSILSSRAEAKREAERKAQAAADYHRESVEMAARLRDLLAKLEASIVPAQTALNSLRNNHPQSVWGSLVKPFEEIDVPLLNSLKLEIDVAEGDAKENQKPEEARNAIGALIRRLTGHIQACDRLIEQSELAERSKAEAKSALEHLPERIEAAEKEANHPDVGDELRGKLGLVKEAFFKRQAEVSGKGDKSIDWIQLNESLKVISGDVAQSVSEARSDKELAQRARIEGPKMLAGIDKIMAELDEKERTYGASRSARAEIETARSQIEQARQYSGSDSTDWMQVYLLMNSINSHNDDADRAYRAHVRRIEEEAAEKKRKADEEARAERRRRESSSSPFSGGHSGGRGGGGSFSSGFSGGHSGGRGGGKNF
ncbi:MAG TPA: TPM domain-containing protein [Candidatus Paceibacterota bacterium]|nr:TPM domain-containing protein [Candidatus Pacearchaeota archaeon]HRZ51058.1 TPM domain-containing protein [Candidatus Paceibacterota bacterium]HSA36783.1 TPM domain-containing protein [Candidatus Paceibacterota bacterium]